MIVLLSAVSAGAASTALDGSAAAGEDAAAALDVVAAASVAAGAVPEEPIPAGVEAVIAAPE